MSFTMLKFIAQNFLKMKHINHNRNPLFITCMLITLMANSQADYTKFYLQKDSFKKKLAALRGEYSRHKVIPAELETECLTALSFYPELKDTYIEFRFGNIKTTMESRPKMNFIFKSKNSRRYVIIISHEKNEATNLDWKQLSFNALVGWIGHELGHVVYYSGINNGGILLTGAQYPFNGFKRKIEHIADQMAINHNLGFALYEGTEYTINHSKATKTYIAKQVKFYFSPKEIIRASFLQDQTASLHIKPTFQN